MTDDVDVDVDFYPLAWPLGWPRWQGERLRATFNKKTRKQSRHDPQRTYLETSRLSLTAGRDRLVVELGRLGAANFVISTNVRTRADGGIRGDAREPDDPGAAVYFEMPDERGKLRRQVLAVDAWNRLADNLAAIAAHIECLRGIDRYHVGTLAQVFAGYKALSAMGERKPWYVVMGFAKRPTRAEAERKYLELMHKHHPDRGGNSNQAAEITAAWREARDEMGWS